MSKYDRVMKKCEKFYRNPKAEETYALDYTLISIIVPRLQLFIDKSSKVIDWDEHTKYSKVDVIKICSTIIEDFDYYLDHVDCGLVDSVEAYNECKKRLQHGFNLLGKVILRLGW